MKGSHAPNQWIAANVEEIKRRRIRSIAPEWIVPYCDDRYYVDPHRSDLLRFHRIRLPHRCVRILLWTGRFLDRRQHRLGRGSHMTAGREASFKSHQDWHGTLMPKTSQGQRSPHQQNTVFSLAFSITRAGAAESASENEFKRIYGICLSSLYIWGLMAFMFHLRRIRQCGRRVVDPLFELAVGFRRSCRAPENRDRRISPCCSCAMQLCS